MKRLTNLCIAVTIFFLPGMVLSAPTEPLPAFIPNTANSSSLTKEELVGRIYPESAQQILRDILDASHSNPLTVRPTVIHNYIINSISQAVTELQKNGGNAQDVWIRNLMAYLSHYNNTITSAMDLDAWRLNDLEQALWSYANMDGFGFPMYQGVSILGNDSETKAYLNMVSNLLINDAVNEKQFNRHLKEVISLLRQLNAAANIGNAEYYNGAMMEIINVFGRMMSGLRSYCSGKLDLPLESYVRRGSSARSHLREIISVVTLSHELGAQDEAIMEKSLGMLAKWYKARPSRSWKKFINKQVLAVMDASASQSFASELREELQRSYFSAMSQEDKEIACSTDDLTSYCELQTTDSTVSPSSE